MSNNVIERPALTLPVDGSESAFIGQLLQVLQQHGHAINQLLGAYEAGTFTPELTFATPGDLANVYAVQIGNYWRVGPLVFFEISLNVTPTYTTASGLLSLQGLPYAAKTEAGAATMMAAYISSTGFALPAGDTSLVAFVNNALSEVRISAVGAGAATSIGAGHLTTAVAASIFVSGFYPTDEFSNP